MSDTVSSAVQAIEAEIVVQQSRRDLILRHLQQPTMVPGTRVYAAHANRAETLRYEILGLQRALAVVKHREASQAAYFEALAQSPRGHA